MTIIEAIDLLKALVETNSHHQNHTGVKRVQEKIEAHALVLGLTVQGLSGAPTPEVLRVVGSTAQAGGKKIILLCHADTVFPETSTFQHFKISADQTEAFGPGVIDNKGGIVVGLWALHKLTAMHHPHGVELWVMPEEEIGSPHHKQWLKDHSKEVNLSLGLEPALDDGSIIHSRRGNMWVELSCLGPGGHAGRDAERVPHPAHQLIQTLAPLLDPTPSHPRAHYTLTVGSFRTNTEGYNAIPAQARARLDLRFDTFEGKQAAEERIQQAFADSAIEPKITENCPPFPKPQNIDRLLTHFCAHLSRVESRPIESQHAFGSSDTNNIARPDLWAIDGLGPYGSGLHTEQERLWIASLETRSTALAQAISTLPVMIDLP